MSFERIIIYILVVSIIGLVWKYPIRKENKIWKNSFFCSLIIIYILVSNYYRLVMIGIFPMTKYCYVFSTFSGSEKKTAVYRFIYNGKEYMGFNSTGSSWEDNKNLNRYYKVRFSYKDPNFSEAHLKDTIPRDSVPIEERALLEKQ